MQHAWVKTETLTRFWSENPKGKNYPDFTDVNVRTRSALMWTTKNVH
jgi:hypothetical protein